MKSFEMRLKVDEIRRRETTERTYQAEIKLTDNTDFSEIVEFLEDIKKIWKKRHGCYQGRILYGAGSYRGSIPELGRARKRPNSEIL